MNFSRNILVARLVNLTRAPIGRWCTRLYLNGSILVVTVRGALQTYRSYSMYRTLNCSADRKGRCIVWLLRQPGWFAVLGDKGLKGGQSS